jgi:hypothetical protein
MKGIGEQSKFENAPGRRRQGVLPSSFGTGEKSGVKDVDGSELLKPGASRAVMLIYRMSH